MNQHDHKYDGNEGKSMCDPSAQASVYWSYKVIRDKMKELAAADKACKGKKDKALEDCALRADSC